MWEKNAAVIGIIEDRRIWSYRGGGFQRTESRRERPVNLSNLIVSHVT
jgi:hypothetical protein